MGETHRGTYALAVDHAFLTIEMLAPHLRWLELRAPKLAAALRHVFAYLATPARARPLSRYAVAEVVAILDQWSAATYNGRDLDYLLAKPEWAQSPANVRSLPARSADRRQPQVHYG